MKTVRFRILMILLLVVSILFFLWNSLLLLSKGFARENEMIEITDDNRKEIASLIEEKSALREKLPNIDQIEKIEHLALMHKDQITVYEKDGTTYDLYTNLYNDPLIVYIQKEGYNIYFRSSELIPDLVKIIFWFVVSIVLAVPLISVANKRFSLLEKRKKPLPW